MNNQKKLVKSWYDGFVFGNTHDIYNPWSITNFLDKKQVRPYWADTSSNSMIDELIRKASTDIKEKMEELLQGKEIVVNFDEQIVFEQLDQDENAIWSLMLKWLSESRADRISGRFVRAMVSSANHQSGNNSNVYNYV